MHRISGYETISALTAMENKICYSSGKWSDLVQIRRKIQNK